VPAIVFAKLIINSSFVLLSLKLHSLKQLFVRLTVTTSHNYNSKN